ncbi:DDE-type integrase/transposase/recombinase [Saccharothrix deserti]|uniref:DDE-type integrase/transposase/recombinase n=1 Tax=Saccharothrix deserti TaxID=2593674 RepID=UPI00131CFF9E
MPAADLVDHDFVRDAPNQLWIPDVTEHRTREGKVYCAVVLDAFSRKVVGWSIDSRQDAALVTNALGMALRNREAAAGTVIHSDHGVQLGFNRSSPVEWGSCRIGRRVLVDAPDFRGATTAQAYPRGHACYRWNRYPRGYPDFRS